MGRAMVASEVQYLDRFPDSRVRDANLSHDLAASEGSRLVEGVDGCAKWIATRRARFRSATLSRKHYNMHLWWWPLVVATGGAVCWQSILRVAQGSAELPRRAITLLIVIFPVLLQSTADYVNAKGA
jgi:hypothetical protein